MKFNSFNSLIEYVLSKATDEQKVSIQEEVSVIKANKWENYFVFIANLIETGNRCAVVFFLGSAKAYTIIKILDITPDYHRICQKRDVLDFVVDIAGSQDLRLEELKNLSQNIDILIDSLNLNKVERILQPLDRFSGSELMLISNQKISENETEVFNRTEIGDYPNELKNCLVLYIGTRYGL